MRVDANAAEAGATAVALALEPCMNGAASPRPPVSRSLLAIEPNGTDHFVSGLSGPGAMQLVVDQLMLVSEEQGIAMGRQADPAIIGLYPEPPATRRPR